MSHSNSKVLVALVSIMFSQLQQKAQIIFDIPGATETYVTGINIATDVCGYAVFPDGVKGFVKTPTDTIMIEFASDVDTWMGGINDQGQLVGRYNPTGATTDYHCFIYNVTDETMTDMPQLDGFEYLQPNDISNNGWISGDLKDAAQRRIFRYHEDVGMETDFVLIGPDVWPTYGGHEVREDGGLSAFYLINGDFKGVYFDENLVWGAGDTVNLPDPINPNAHKTKIMGGSVLYSLINFGSSKTTYIFNKGAQTLGAKLKIPFAEEVYGLDINEEDYICGYYKDTNYVVHGFFQGKANIDFLPSVNGWDFVNTGSVCWNEEDFTGINYGVDPYYAMQYGQNIYFPGMTANTNFPDTSFVSWIDWVHAFGEQECYDTDPNVGYMEQNPNAFHVWKKNRGSKFDGICWGMVSNALLAYESIPVLNQVYPNLTGLFATETAATLDWPTTEEQVIPRCRQSQVKQFSTMQWARIQEGYTKRPHEMIDEIYSGLRDPQATTKQLGIVLVGEEVHGQHALMPYKMTREPGNINQYNIYVYDPNEPTFDDFHVVVDYSDTFSSYSYYFGSAWTEFNVFGLKYEEWVDNFTQPIHVAPITAAPEENRDGNVILTLPANPELNITGGQGGSIDVMGNDYSNTLIGSQTIFLYTGQNEKPSNFLLAPGEYDISVSSTSDQDFSAYFQTDEGSIVYTRPSTSIGENDALSVTNTECLYTNSGSESVNVNAYVLTSDDEGSTYQYYCDNLDLAIGQTVGLDIIDATHVMITSAGGSSTYDVRIRIFNEATGFWECTSAGIAIGSGVTQQIIPELTGDTFNGVTIETDANQDGDFETTENFDNDGLPNMMLSQSEVNVPALAASGTFYISNVGAGNLNWSVASAPSWITVDEGATGINHGPLTFSAADNFGETRQEWLIVEAAAPANDQDSVLVTQLGINGIESLSAQMLMTMQPNPANGRVQFSRKELLGSAVLSYEIYNAAGSKITSGTMSANSMTLDVSEWSGGVYTVRFTAPANSFVMRLVVTE